MSGRYPRASLCLRWGCTIVAISGALLGCQEVLFKKDATRTQFETHDRLRQRYVPLQQDNVFGEPEPALRARLSPNG